MFYFFLLLLRSSTLPIGSPRSCLFLCSSELQIVCLQICSSSVLYSSSDPFFLCSFRSFLVCSSPKSSLRELVLLFRTRVYKIGDLCGIILPWVLDWNRVFKTRDASLQKIFKRLLTYDIVSPHYARLQISPIFLCLIAILKILFIWPFFLCYQILKSTIWYQNQWFFFFFNTYNTCTLGIKISDWTIL